MGKKKIFAGKSLCKINVLMDSRLNSRITAFNFVADVFEVSLR